MASRFTRTPAPTFWVTNISKREVSLRDLNHSIPPMSTVNLLDKRHHSYTKEQLDASASSGSIFTKSDKIKVRLVPPPHLPPNLLPIDRESAIPTRQRSALKIEHVHYEELNISDDEFAKENADLAEQDRLGKYSKETK